MIGVSIQNYSRFGENLENRLQSIFSDDIFLSITPSLNGLKHCIAKDPIFLLGLFLETSTTGHCNVLYMRRSLNLSLPEIIQSKPLDTSTISFYSIE